MHYAVLGAGEIGCFIGGHLAAAGYEVSFVGRHRQASQFKQQGVRLRPLQGVEKILPPDKVCFHTKPDILNRADAIIVAVRCLDTLSAAKVLLKFARSHAVVISFQNGIRNAAQINARLRNKVLAGMALFNIVRQDSGIYCQATSGHLCLQNDCDISQEISDNFTTAELPVSLESDMESVLWSKLVLNLNNPVNALSRLPLHHMLLDRNYRCVIAAAQSEALNLLDEADIKTKRLGSLYPPLVPRVLRMPTSLVELAAKTSFPMLPMASTSMQEDLRMGKPSEIDHINGEVIRLADKLKLPCPVNRRLVDLVHRAENQGPDYQAMSGATLMNEIRG